jgi:calcineurin-like phosphoesterase family protein
MIYVTSDTHFGNENIIKYCERPFVDVEDQTRQLIENWNNVVRVDDVVIHLGDFIMGAADNVDRILPQLNGQIILVRGNHDTPSKLARYKNYSDKITVHDIYFQPYGGLFFICCHFPVMHEEFLDMVNKDNSEAVVLYGHVHNKLPFADMKSHTFNCSTDVTGYTPVTLSSIWTLVRDDFVEKGVWKGK